MKYLEIDMTDATTKSMAELHEEMQSIIDIKEII